MKRILQVPTNRPLADFLPTLTIKAKDFATELTSHNVVDKDLKGDAQITKEHIENNLAVRKILVIFLWEKFRQFLKQDCVNKNKNSRKLVA